MFQNDLANSTQSLSEDRLVQQDGDYQERNIVFCIERVTLTLLYELAQVETVVPKSRSFKGDFLSIVIGTVRSGKSIQTLAGLAIVLATSYTELIRMRKATRDGIQYTQRDLYYTNPAVFISQAHTERLIEKVCHLIDLVRYEQTSHCGRKRVRISTCLRTVREDLAIGATSKSIIAGPIVLILEDGQRINVGAFGDNGFPVGSSIGRTCVRAETSSNKLTILVVEKECTFRNLLYNDRLLQRHIAVTTTASKNHPLPPALAVVCGRGYPCVALRSLLRALCTATEGPRASVAFLVDGDPDGVGIMLNYLTALLPSSESAFCKIDTPVSRYSSPFPNSPQQHISVSNHPFKNEEVPGSSLRFSWLGIRPSHATPLRELSKDAAAVLPIESLTPRCLRRLAAVEVAAQKLLISRNHPCRRSESAAEMGLSSSSSTSKVSNTTISLFSQSRMKSELSLTASRSGSSSLMRSPSLREPSYCSSLHTHFNATTDNQSIDIHISDFVEKEILPELHIMRRIGKKIELQASDTGVVKDACGKTGESIVEILGGLTTVGQRKLQQLISL